MPRYFTHYWTNKTWGWSRASGTGNDLLDHIAGNMFRKRNVSKDDVIYVATVVQGKLYLCGKLKVDRICEMSKAASILNCDIYELWDAGEHILASEATTMDFKREIPLDVTESLKFRSGEKLKPLAFVSPGHLDQQTLRGVRELDEDSALKLDEFLPPLEAVSALRSEQQRDIPLAELTYPNEVPDAQTYSEGAVKQVLVNAYERSPEARKACIAHYGLTCSVCDFNFEKFYGKVGEGYIHVHHRVPLSEIGATYEVDPVKDLIPVCSNCHAMLHRETPPYEIDQLRQLMEANRQRKEEA
ncbi:HNH endonuclease [Leptolyngbya sp. FACHB-321]|uniref:HNH endonuclease n=1 Tax=Leptolyngbya sp. FACHB-321 TaxID=2692807 RepID=UPI0018F02F03|nr:HNH endonuclease [Leptolyngbya sp. FACHB-321]